MVTLKSLEVTQISINTKCYKDFLLVRLYDKMPTVNEHEVDLHVLTCNADLSPSKNGQARDDIHGISPV